MSAGADPPADRAAASDGDASIDAFDRCLRAALDGDGRAGAAPLGGAAPGWLEVCARLRGEGGDDGDGGAGPDASLPALRPGARLDRFALVRRLGTGGQGQVWLATDTAAGQDVAIKVLRDDLLGATARRRFLREHRVAGALRHPGLCAAREAGEAGGTPFLVMPFVRGATLAEHLRAARSGTPDEALPVPLGARGPAAAAACVLLAERIADALQCVHDAGLLHRDVKPANVMLDADGSPVVLDFGLLGGAAVDTSCLTGSGDRLGSPCYMAPEQAAGRPGAVGAHSDVFSLAVVLYECLTLQRPFAAHELPVLHLRGADALPPDPRVSNPAVSPSLARVLARALAADPACRYASMAAFAADLQSARLGRRVRAHRASPLAAARRWTRRRPFAALLVGAFVLLAPLAAGMARELSVRRADVDAGIAALRRSDVQAARTRLLELHLRADPRARGVARTLLELDPLDLAALHVVLGAAGSRQDVLAAITARRDADRPRPLWRRLEAVACGEMQPLPDPGDAADVTVGEAHWLRAQTLQARCFAGDVLALRESAVELERAVLAWSGTPPAMLVFHWGLAALRVGDGAAAERARHTLRSLYSDDPSWPAIDVEPDYFLRPEAGVEGLRRRLQQCPDDVLLLDALGQQLCRATTTRDEGLSMLRRAHALRPEDPYRAFVLGRQLAADAGTAAEAVACLEHCVRQQPWNGPATSRLGQAMIAAGRTAAGAELLHRAVALDDPAGVSHAILGRHLAEGGRGAAALAPLGVAVARAPGQPAWRALLAATLEGLCRYEQALEQARIAFALDPAGGHEDVAVRLLRLLHRDAEIPALLAASPRALAQRDAGQGDDPATAAREQTSR